MSGEDAEAQISSLFCPRS